MDGTMLMKRNDSTPRVLFLVRDVRENTPVSGANSNGLPKERHWGLPVLQEYAELQVTPWFLGAQHAAWIERFVERLFPPPAVFWSRVLPSLAKRLEVAQDNYDVALSVHNGATATLLWLRQQRHFRPRIICLLIGLADWLERAKPDTRRQTLQYLAGADCLLALGPAEVEFLRSCGLAQTRFLPFGVDTEYWAPTGEPMSGYVLAVGSDPSRDFDTLLRACTYPLRIMTRARHLINVPIPPNVSFVQGDTDALRRLYAKARVVVVPLKDRLQPSGQNTVLQAMAMGKPVILTRTRGTWTDKLRDGQNCVYVPPYDPRALTEAIDFLCDSSNAKEIGKQARNTVQKYFDARNLAEAIAASVHEVVAR